MNSVTRRNDLTCKLKAFCQCLQLVMTCVSFEFFLWMRGRKLNTQSHTNIKKNWFSTLIQDFTYLYDPNNETAGAFVPSQILYDAFHVRYQNSAGVIVLLFAIWGSLFFGGLSITTSSAKVAYAPSIDKGVSFSLLWRKLHPKHKVPTNVVWLCAAICILLGLPILKVNVVFTTITSICTIGWVGGYAAP
ncbi:amino-acid permease BAT1 homolog isoform X1 [Vicia villosa]|uniref:amino-acid permease BAT1 homolog isoform X1 n=1 Tax=Vicia villosa TaxID=3911 RepID=UPI00273C79AF|nr:amino-acid permease BAT1 homolog isoform X1 [Vicia villosa]